MKYIAFKFLETKICNSEEEAIAFTEGIKSSWVYYKPIQEKAQDSLRSPRSLIPKTKSQMKTIYILSSIYTAENDRELKDTKFTRIFPQCAGTKEAVERQLQHHIEDAKKEGKEIIELSSEDVHMGRYFERVVKLGNSGIFGNAPIFGISLVTEV